jgi:hypothetical protein
LPPTEFCPPWPKSYLWLGLVGLISSWSNMSSSREVKYWLQTRYC